MSKSLGKCCVYRCCGLLQNLVLLHRPIALEVRQPGNILVSLGSGEAYSVPRPPGEGRLLSNYRISPVCQLSEVSQASSDHMRDELSLKGLIASFSTCHSPRYRCSCKPHSGREHHQTPNWLMLDRGYEAIRAVLQRTETRSARQHLVFFRAWRLVPEGEFKPLRDLNIANFRWECEAGSLSYMLELQGTSSWRQVQSRPAFDST